MPLSPYDPCPCGSGKKLKFCCQAISDEMDRAIRLLEGNQPRVALQQLDSLARKHPANTWIDTTRALILVELGEATTARDLMRALLEVHPEHEFSTVLLAAATFQAEGFDAAKKSVHRAFQRGAKKFPSMVSGLAGTMASVLFQRNRLIAAREHLGLALKLAPEDRRQDLFIQLLEIDGDAAIPYPLRGSHALPTVSGGTEEQQKEIKKAQKYAAVGCWNTAADLFLAQTRTITDSAELWHSVGLCRAWDGDEVQAADALHRAAQLYADNSTAVECETLAQLFDRHNTTDIIDICTYEAKVESIGRLLTVLDENPRLLRFPIPQESGDNIPPVAGYQILDRPKWTGDDFSQLSMDTVPKFQAHIAVYDAIPETNDPPSVYLTGDRGSDLDDAKTVLESAAQGLIQWVADKPQPEVTGAVPTEGQFMRWRWSLPENTPVRLSRELKAEQWRRVLNEAWPNTPQKPLSGRTPGEAASDPAKKVALTAAVYVLDALAHQQGHNLNVSEVLGRYGLEPLATLEVEESTPLAALSLMQMHRLPVEGLSDPQLISVVNRALLTRHEGFLYRVLKVALARPACEAEMDLQRSLRAMVELCVAFGRRDEALEWVAVARTKQPQDKSQFEYQWNWDMTELALRLEDASDPALKPLLDRFVNYYSPKVPQLRGYVEGMLKSYGVPSPWESVSIVSASGVGGAVWTPDAPAAAAANPSKLWLPGQ